MILGGKGHWDASFKEYLPFSQSSCILPAEMDSFSCHNWMKHTEMKEVKEEKWKKTQWRREEKMELGNWVWGEGPCFPVYRYEHCGIFTVNTVRTWQRVFGMRAAVWDILKFVGHCSFEKISRLETGDCRFQARLCLNDCAIKTTLLPCQVCFHGPIY